MAETAPNGTGEISDIGRVLLPALPACQPLSDEAAEIVTEPFAKGDIETDRERNLDYVPWPKIAARLDALCGVGGWRLVRTALREQPFGKRICVIWEGLLYGTKIDPPIMTSGDGFYSNEGGRSSPRDAAEAAESRALTKACARLGIGRHMWLKEDKRARAGSTAPPRSAPSRPQASKPTDTAKPPTTTPERTADENAPITKQQIRGIHGSLKGLFGDDEQAAYAWLKEVQPRTCEASETSFHLGELTMAEASAIIVAANKKRSEQRQEAPA